MHESSPVEQEVYEFVLNEIDSVPHLEALLLLWNSRPNPWLTEDVARRLYVAPRVAKTLLQDLGRHGFLKNSQANSEQYVYDSGSEPKDRLMALLDTTYRHQVVRISTLIHSKASSAVLDFARAFRFTKERE